MENSSNTDMEQVFEQLANIKMAEPSTNLYKQTLNRIQRQNIISMFWVSAAACLLIAFACTEIYFSIGKNYSSNKDISSVICQTNNILYNEEI